MVQVGVFRIEQELRLEAVTELCYLAKRAHIECLATKHSIMCWVSYHLLHRHSEFQGSGIEPRAIRTVNAPVSVVLEAEEPVCCGQELSVSSRSCCHEHMKKNKVTLNSASHEVVYRGCANWRIYQKGGHKSEIV
jgi:hypothetical protein